MSLTPGTRLGPYEILSPLGAGGMGEVYRAKDLRLDRTVAIKVLPAHVADSPDARQRFEREAKAVSALNHPNVCTLHDVGWQDGVIFLVLELLEGQTLEDRLAKGPLPPDQVLRHGIEIAAGLESAHRRGIIHRDLKPANVMLTRSGVKLLDFGLAKQGPDGGEAVILGTETGFTASPTATGQKSLTAEGAILGTMQYMAPEQLEGKPADARTDVFALGLLLYEMATGRRAFEARSQASLIAAILTSAPRPISTYEPLAPASLDRVVMTCLAKDPDDRRQTAHDVGIDLKWIAEEGSRPGQAPAAQPSSPIRIGRREQIAWGATAIAVIGLAAAVPMALVPRRPAPAGRPVRFTLSAPEKTTLAPDLALSPDGRQLVYVAGLEGRENLWIRPLDALKARLLPETEGVYAPFWSPDNRSVGFFARGRLKRIDIPTGAVQVLADATEGRGGTWNSQGEILFTPDVTSPLMRVPAAGGTATPVTTLDIAQHEINHRWPRFLPDGRHFLYMARSLGVQESIRIGSLDSQDRRTILKAQSGAVYVPSGHLLFVRDRTLFAQGFDAEGLRLTGEPAIVATGVLQIGEAGPTGYPAFSASSSGLLVYREGGGGVNDLAWFDRRGARLGQIGTAADFSDPALSPDGRQVALARETSDGGTSDIYLVDVARGALSRFTYRPQAEAIPVWSPDGTQIVFASNDAGYLDLFRKPASGEGDEEPILKTAGHKFPDDWSPDGRFVVYEVSDPETRFDLWLLPMTGEPKPRVFLKTRFNEGHARVSPDGRWIAYTSDESGRREIYVQAFPDKGGKRQISSAGGDQPAWRRDGGEIFYLAPDGTILSAAVRKGGTFEVDPPKALFRSPNLGASVTKGYRNNYIVTPDGQRFLISVTVEGGSTPITAVLGWTADLK
jgi:Tol biopolymer transport system component